MGRFEHTSWMRSDIKRIFDAIDCRTIDGGWRKVLKCLELERSKSFSSCTEWQPLDALSFESTYLRTWILFIGRENAEHSTGKALEADFVVHLSPDLSLNCTTCTSVCWKLCRVKLFVAESNGTKNFPSMCGGIWLSQNKRAPSQLDD